MKDENDNGIRILIDMLDRAMSMPAEASPSPRSVQRWYMFLKRIGLMLPTASLVDQTERAEEAVVAMWAGGHMENAVEAVYEYFGSICSAIEEQFGLYGMQGSRVTGPAMTVLHDALVKISLQEPPRNIRSVYFYSLRIRSAHALSSPFHTEEYTRIYGAVVKRLHEAAVWYPEPSYVLRSADALYTWTYGIVDLYQSHGILVPENLRFTDTAKGQRIRVVGL